MRILVTGANGQLGQQLLASAGARTCIAAYHSQPPPGWKGEAVALDLGDDAAIRHAVAASKADWILHAGAMTDVDACERQPDVAARVNGHATGVLAQAAVAADARLLVVSTDYVYDGVAGPYREGDATNPIQQYGASKLAGEQAALAACPDVVIARTAVVYGPHKKNFVTWLLGELRAGRPARIVEDQLGTPTSTLDLAQQLYALMEGDAAGVYHTAGGESCSRLVMARRVAEVFGLDPSLIAPARMADMKWAARRPADARLDTSRIAKLKRPFKLSEALESLKDAMSP